MLVLDNRRDLAPAPVEFKDSVLTLEKADDNSAVWLVDFKSR